MDFAALSRCSQLFLRCGQRLDIDRYVLSINVWAFDCRVSVAPIYMTIFHQPTFVVYALRHSLITPPEHTRRTTFRRRNFVRAPVAGERLCSICVCSLAGKTFSSFQLKGYSDKSMFQPHVYGNLETFGVHQSGGDANNSLLFLMLLRGFGVKSTFIDL